MFNDPEDMIEGFYQSRGGDPDDYVDPADLTTPDVPLGYSLPAEPQPTSTEVSPGVWLPANGDLRWKSKRPPREYIIEDVLPTKGVHLLAGPSGAGKTTLAFQLLEAVATGQPWLGHATKKMKVAYISADRASISVWETLDRMELDIEVFSLVDEQMEKASLTDVIIPRLTAKFGGRPDLIYIDGFTSMCPGGQMNNYMDVALWLAALQRYVQKIGTTILGAVHTAKVREGEEIKNVRQKVLGSVSWAGYSETVIIVEPSDSTDVENNKRVVYICPRNRPETREYAYVEEGKLVLHGASKEAEVGAASFLLDRLLPTVSVDLDGTFPHNRLWLMAENKGVKRRTFDAWLKKHVDNGKIFKLQRGIYSFSGAKTS